ncbi:MAG: hypothetical protein Pyrs2KO_21630 [Pyruvatibacter sp.]
MSAAARSAWVTALGIIIPDNTGGFGWIKKEPAYCIHGYIMREYKSTDLAMAIQLESMGHDDDEYQSISSKRGGTGRCAFCLW